MSGGTVSPILCGRFLPCFFAFFCSTAPQAFFRPDRRFRTPARAEAVKVGRRSAIEAHFDVSRPRLESFEHGGRLDDCGPEERLVVEFLYLFSVCFGMLVVCGSSVNVHVACDDRISSYPAAPFRLATLLHAWTIAQVGRGSSLARQTGWARSANPHNSHTSNPPDAPEGASEL
jgi:hypothetical protein